MVDKFAEANNELSDTPFDPAGEPPPHSVSGAAEQLRPGQLVEGHYKIISVIAQGGFGCVYKVRNVFTKQIFAIKTLHARGLSDIAMLRFRKEAETASKLEHPNLVRAYDFGLIAGAQPFLVMDFVEGPTLAEHLKQHARLPLETALEVFIPMCFAMSYAHDQGIIHRDIKPGNIVLALDPNDPERCVPKIVDFGIAKLQLGQESEALSLTRTGEVFGTPLYMSPEQCAGEAVDKRSDIYAFGCVMFEALTGAPPFRGNTALETMMQHASTKPMSLKEASLGIDFPPAMERIMSRMLAKEARNRFQSFSDLGSQLLELQSGDSARLKLIAVPSGTSKVARNLLARPWWYHPLFALALGVALTAVASQYLRVPTVRSEVTTQRNNQDSPRFLENVNDLHDELDQYFRREGTSSVFHFSTAGNDIGELHCWNKGSGKSVEIQAQGPVDVGRNSKVVLLARPTLLADSYHWGHFRKDDLDGVVLYSDKNSNTRRVLLETDDSSTMFGVASQRKLSILECSDLVLSQRAFSSIGLIESLRYLRIKGGQIVDGKTPHLIDGADVAALANLRNLDTLCLANLTGVGSVLKRLEGSKLRRLCLFDCPLTPQEFIMLKKIRSLEYVGLHQGNRMGLGEPLDCLAELPNLKELAIGAINLGYSRVRPTKKMSQLERLVVIGQPVDRLIENEFRAMANPALSKHTKYERSAALHDAFPWEMGINQNPFELPRN